MHGSLRMYNNVGKKERKYTYMQSTCTRKVNVASTIRHENWTHTLFHHPVFVYSLKAFVSAERRIFNSQ